MNEEQTTIHRHSIEVCDNTFHILLIAIIAAVVITIPWSMVHYYNARVEAAFKYGYEEGTLSGPNGSGWVKHKQQ